MGAWQSFSSLASETESLQRLTDEATAGAMREAVDHFVAQSVDAVVTLTGASHVHLFGPVARNPPCGASMLCGPPLPPE